MTAAAILTGNPSPHLLQETMYAKNDPKTKMKAAAENYEAVYLNQMFSQMFEGIPTEGLGHGGQAEETWRGMLINEYSKSVAKAGGIGLAKQIYHDLVRVQEHSTQ